MGARASGTATSNRKSDQVAKYLERSFRNAKLWKFGTRWRKVVRPVPLTSVRELSAAGDIPTAMAGVRTIGVSLADLLELSSGAIPGETVTIGVPLESLREINVVGETADVLADDDMGGTLDAAFGLLGNATTPKLVPETGEGGASQVTWAASGNDPVQFSIPVPDIDTASDVTVTIRAGMASTTDTPVLDLDSYFDEGDTKLEDASGTVDEVITDLAVTIAATDVPSGAKMLGVELTPAAHTTDELYIYGIWVTYTTVADRQAGRLSPNTTPSLDTADGDTDGQHRVTWVAAGVDSVGLQVSLPDIDVSAAVTVTVRAKMSNTNDTPTIILNSYFNEGDDKISDTSGTVDSTTDNITTTIAATDVPTGARVLSVELTPAAHNNDILYLYDVRVGYTTTTGEGGGGILDKDTTPIFEAINGDSDGCKRLNWAASDSDPIGFAVDLEDIDTNEDLIVCVRESMSSTTDTPTLGLDSYFNEADTKVEDTVAAAGATYAEREAIIAASDIPAGAAILNIELTPGAHTTDALYVTRIHVEYTEKVPADD